VYSSSAHQLLHEQSEAVLSAAPAHSPGPEDSWDVTGWCWFNVVVAVNSRHVWPALQMVRLDEVPEAFSGIASVDRGENDNSSPQ
jgi:hypothetical protein